MFPLLLFNYNFTEFYSFVTPAKYMLSNCRAMSRILTSGRHSIRQTAGTCQHEENLSAAGFEPRPYRLSNCQAILSYRRIMFPHPSLAMIATLYHL